MLDNVTNNRIYKITDGVLVRANVSGDMAVIPEGVIAIGAFAFNNNWRLKTVIIPASVRIIDKNSFFGCTALETIMINNPYVDIGEGAFDSTAWYRNQVGDCLMLGSILYRYRGYERNPVFPRGISSICGGVLDFPQEARSIVVPEGVQVISESAFRSARIERITLPAGLKHIGSHAFSGCTRLKEITLPEELESLDDNAFEKCERLCKINLPSRLKSLECQVFRGCHSLTEINISEGLEVIKDYAFTSCKSLTTLRFPNSLRSIGRYAFNNCQSLREVVLPERLAAKNIHRLTQSALLELYFNGNLQCGAQLIGAFRRAVAKNRMAYFEKILKKGNGGAVEKFFGLWQNAYPEDFDLYAKVCAEEKNAEMAAAVMVHKGKVYPPDRLAKYEQDKEDKAMGLKPYTVSDYQRIYRWRTTVQGITITGYTGEDAVLELPERIGKTPVIGIGDAAFMICNTIETVYLPKTIAYIGARAFAGCENLTAVYSASPLQELGYMAFKHCTALATLPKIADNAQIGANVFEETRWAREQGDYPVFRKTLIGYNGTDKNLVIPEGVESVDSRVFLNRYDIESVVFPKSLKSLGSECFAFCKNLEEVVFTADLKRIGAGAFGVCTALKKVVMPFAVDVIDRALFTGCSSFTMYIPKGSAYKRQLKEDIARSRIRVVETTPYEQQLLLPKEKDTQ